MSNDQSYLYWYKSEYNLNKPAYDGDTLRLNIDLGFNIWIHGQIFRLKDIDAWEIRGEERPLGIISRDELRSRLESATIITIHTNKDKTGKYGRYIADLYIDGELINDWLVKEGYAEHKEY